MLMWLRANLFNNAFNSAVTLLLGASLLYALSLVWGWGIGHAVWVADADQCHAARGVGACWGVVAEKYRVIIFGRYPFEAQWRPLLATLLLMALLLASCMRMFWKPWLVALWVAVLAALV